MPDNFDISGLDADPYSGTTNNASADFKRLQGSNPDQFGGGIFNRLFGGSKGTASAPAPAGAPPPPVPVTSPLPANPASGSPPPQAAPQPSTSSGKGLVSRILDTVKGTAQYDAEGKPRLVPGTPFTPDEYRTQLAQALNPVPQFNQRDPMSPNPGGLSIPQFNGPQPPMRQAPSVGEQMSMHARPGGNTFGGQTFGGNRFGASAVPQMPASPAAGPAAGPAVGTNPGQSILNLMLGGFGTAPQQSADSRGGFFRGAANHDAYRAGPDLGLMRGGYPAHLMMGLPQRYARGGPDGPAPDYAPSNGSKYVDDAGQGDGRSDHVKAVLSPGEFVQDAETTALLGNGDSDAGARGWEAIRQVIRKEKGKSLAKGKFSPNAKSPQQYARVGMKAAAKGDR